MLRVGVLHLGYIANSLNNLAELYRAHRNYQQAEPLYLRSLAILEKVLGKEHPYIATILNNLALLYQAKGDITRATDFLRRRGLVVLSACDTGKGDVKVGDGVYGLRRALVMAGSQTQVLSLWRVDDEATKDLMVKYYQNLQALKGRHDALRPAQLEMLNSEEYQHPQYWAAFVPSGNWTPLSSK